MVSGGAIAVNVVAERRAGARRSGFAGWRSARRSRRSRNGAAAACWLLRRRLGGLDGRRLAMTFAKIVRGVGRDGARGRSRFSARWSASGRASGLLPQVVRLGASIGGGLVGAGVARRMLLRVDEFGDASRSIIRAAGYESCSSGDYSGRTRRPVRIWYDSPEPAHAPSFFTLRLVVLLRPRAALDGAEGADRRQRRDVPRVTTLRAGRWLRISGWCRRSCCTSSGCGSSRPTCSCTAGSSTSCSTCWRCGCSGPSSSGSGGRATS